MKGQGNFVIPFIFVQKYLDGIFSIFISNMESSSFLWYDIFIFLAILSKLIDIGTRYVVILYKQFYKIMSGQ